MNNILDNLWAVGTRPTATPSVVVRRVVVDRKYWQEHGWRLRGDELRGYYRTLVGSFEGYIKLYDSGDHMFYIRKPPEQLCQHPHWPCFSDQGNGWYWVHFNIRPKNVDSGIVVIETILRESLEWYV